ncbi:MAG: ribonuclease P protein component [Chitinophagales bacterium]|nr:ribonuclease P protein component [Chitinophagales bacterium]
MYTLRKSERLKSRKKIDRLFAEGTVISEHPVRAKYILSAEYPAIIQAGFSVSKKKFKSAVKRNRIKRLMREAWRIHCIPVKSHLEQTKTTLSIFLTYSGTDIPDYILVEQSVIKIVNRLHSIVRRNAGNIKDTENPGGQ